MKKFIIVSSLAVAFVGCSSSSKHDSAGLEKYPTCYHVRLKLEKRCIELNDSGKKTTVMDLENNAYPGQYD